MKLFSYLSLRQWLTLPYLALVFGVALLIGTLSSRIDIKEAQIDLFGRRASCHRYQANQLRLLLAALAYTLMINLRRLALRGTELERVHRHDPHQTAQDWRGHRAQHPPGARAAGFEPPAQARVRHRSACARPLKLSQCCPRHADKQRG